MASEIKDQYLLFEALLLGIQYFTRNIRNFRKRVSSMQDKIGFIVAVMVDWISSSSINQFCRSIASMALAVDIDVNVNYIISEFSHVDVLSRFKWACTPENEISIPERI